MHVMTVLHVVTFVLGNVLCIVPFGPAGLDGDKTAQNMLMHCHIYSCSVTSKRWDV